jgi:predicted TIM-barrel fold metal-dependent hydrolase
LCNRLPGRARVDLDAEFRARGQEEVSGMCPVAVAAGAVDVHGHASPPSFQRAVGQVDAATARRFANLTEHARALTDLAGRPSAMDDAGIGAVLLSVPPPGAELVGPRSAPDLARATNEELLAAAEDHPDRFRVLLTVPLSDPAASARVVDEFGAHPLAAGISALAHHREHRLDDRAYDDVWQLAAARGLPVQLHPAFEEPPGPLRDWALPTSLDAVFSTTLVAARLMLSGALDRAPGLLLGIPHLGGTLPYLAQRLVDQSGTGDAEHDVAHYLRTRVLLDSCSYQPSALRCALDVVGSDRIALGSDFPFRGPLARAVDDLATAGLPDEDRHRLLRDNAIAAFGLSTRADDPLPEQDLPGR